MMSGSMATSSSKKGLATTGKGFDDLSCEILCGIFSRLPPISIAHCAAVCSSWHHTVSSTSGLWRSAYFLDQTRLKLHRTETASSSTAEEKKNADDDEEDGFRTRYIGEEQRTRLARGPVSTRSWRAHSGRVNCCRMVMGQIVSGSSDRTVRVWCAKTFKCTEQYKVPEKAPVVQVEFDAAKVMGAAGKDVFVWSRTGSRRLLRRMGGHSEICSICVADSDLAMGCTDGTVRVFDLYSSRCTQMFRMHTEAVKGVVMDMATQSMASASNDGTVQLFDARSGERYGSLFKPPSMTGISCLHSSPLDHRLFAATMGGHLFCYDLRNRKPCWNVRVGGGALTCMDSPSYSSATIGVGGIDGEIKVFEVASAERIASFRVKPSVLPSSPVLSMALGMTRLVSCHADWSIVQWQLGESRSDSVEAGDPYGREVVKTRTSAPGYPKP